MNNKIEIYDGLTYQQNKLWELIFPHDEERINFELCYQFAFKKFNNFFIRQKIAAFDMDHTLVKPKNNRKFPKDENDWEWYNESVVGKLKKLWSREKYCIIIFSNQKYYDNNNKIRYGLRKKYKLKWLMIQKIVEQLGDLPILFNVSFGNKSRKPNRLMFDFLKRFRKRIYVFDSVNSFYVGDALGRKGDFSDSDKKFAINCGFGKYYAPEEYFKVRKKDTKKKKPIPPKKYQEVIIMMGYPGSGKSTTAKEIEGSKSEIKYEIISGDKLKTTERKLKKLRKVLESGNSAIVDSTNPSKEMRKKYLDIANELKVKARLIHMTTSYEESWLRNSEREKVVPKVAFNIFKGKFEKPEKEEGFDEILER